ncbi:Ig-like domain repeat protein [Myxococcaceae bacterium JPH2]|nr:Ig-like domain repeat protein [Myxococcaceae bacterium JPH2]
MKVSLMKALVLGLIVLAPLAARSELDTFFLGRQTTTDHTYTNGEAVNRYAWLTANANSGTSALAVTFRTGDESSIAVGDLVMVIQTAQSGLTPGSASPFDLDASTSSVGKWEFAVVASVSSSSIGLTKPLVNSYVSPGAQVVRVPEWNDVTVQASATISPPAWDGRTGGILAFLATGTVTLADNAAIDASGKGFRGGVFVYRGGTSPVNDDNTSGANACTASANDSAVWGALKGEGFAYDRFGVITSSAISGGTNPLGGASVGNAGGAGYCLRGGGGGGGNGNIGGSGGKNGASTASSGGGGGAQITYTVTQRLTLGGGGGSGHVDDTAATSQGGAGGGLIYIRANAIAKSGTGTHEIRANGANGTAGGAHAGGAGGGAGGTLSVRVVGTLTCGDVVFKATGGSGGGNASAVASGGGGGGGRIHLQAPNAATCAAGDVLVTAGAKGGSSPNTWDGTAGQLGTTNVVNAGLTNAPTVAIDFPAEGAALNSTTATQAITGHFSSGAGSTVATVELYLNGVLLTSLTVPAGTTTFSYSVPSGLAESSPIHSLTATSKMDGLANMMAPPRTFTVDRTAPTVTSLLATANSSPLLTGATTRFGTVRFIAAADDVAASFLCKLGSAGPVSCTMPHDETVSTDGSYHFEVFAQDAAGNVSAAPRTFDWTLDTVPPTAPVISSPTHQQMVGGSVPVSGTVDGLGQSVDVYVDGSATAQAATVTGMTWSVTLTPVFTSSGGHFIQAVARDAAGNVSPMSIRVFTVDVTPPAAPVILSPAMNARVPTLKPMVQVSAEVGSGVTAAIQSSPISVNVAAGAGPGLWNLQPAANLTDGTAYTMVVTATDAYGNASTSNVTFTVDVSPPAAPTVSQPVNGGPPLTSNVVHVTGTAEAGSTVSFTLGSSPLGTVLATGGAFSFDIPVSLADGAYLLKVQATDVAGNLSAVTNVNFSMDTQTPAPPVIAQPTQGSAVPSKTPSFSGTAEGNSFVSLAVTATGATTGGPYTASTTAAAGGGWTISSLTPATPLSEGGTYVVTATATDAAGHVSAVSASVAFRIDTLSPAAPVIVEPASNAFVKTTTPLLRGTAEPGATVKATFPGAIVIMALANSTGDWALTAPALSQGALTVTVIATDAAAHDSPAATVSFTVDTQAPAAPVVSSPASGALLNTGSPTFSGTAEADATVVIMKGGTGIGTATVSSGGAWTFNAPLSFGEGTQTLTFRTKDRAGNESADSSLTFQVDTVPPPQPIVSSPSGYVTVTSPVIQGTAEANSTVTIRLRRVSNSTVVDKTGTVTAAANGAWSVSSLTPAGALDQVSYTVEAIAQDGAGNTSLLSSLLTFTVDSIPPATPAITYPALNDTVGTATPTLTGTADPNMDVVLKLFGPAPSTAMAREWTLRSSNSGTWKVDVTQAEELATGKYTARVHAVDIATNQSPESADHTFTVDIAVPDTLFTDKPLALTNLALATFAYDSSKPGVSFECSLDGAAYAPCNPSYPVNDGLHSLQARARDTLTGLVDLSPAVWSWTVDTHPPVTTFGLTPPPVTNELGAHFTFAANESGVTYSCELDGTAVADCDGDVSITIVQASPVVTHAFTVHTTDAAGNIELPAASLSWTVNRALPDTTIQTQPLNPSNSSSAAFGFAAVPQDSGTTFECNLDNAGYTRCDPTVTFFGLAHGTHTLGVRARDGLNNADPQPAIFTWVVDLVAPETSFATKPAALSAQALSRFEFSSEPGVTFECQASAAASFASLAATPAFVVCTTPFEETLPDGTYTLSVRAKDLAGNVDATPATFTWKVDTTAPAAPTVAADVRDRMFRTLTPELRGTAEDGSTVFVSVDDGPAQAATLLGGAWSFTPPSALTQGAHAMTVRAVDAAGNASPLSDQVTFTVDTVAPTTTIVSGPDGRIRTSSVLFEFGSNEEGSTFQCSFDGADFEACTGFAREDLSEGTYTLKVRAVDRAGNEGTVVSRSWKVYLGGDIRTKGGGLSCASGGAGDASLLGVALGGLVLLAARRRRGEGTP